MEAKLRRSTRWTIVSIVSPFCIPLSKIECSKSLWGASIRRFRARVYAVVSLTGLSLHSESSPDPTSAFMRISMRGRRCGTAPDMSSLALPMKGVTILHNHNYVCC